MRRGSLTRNLKYCPSNNQLMNLPISNLCTSVILTTSNLGKRSCGTKKACNMLLKPSHKRKKTEPSSSKEEKDKILPFNLNKILSQRRRIKNNILLCLESLILTDNKITFQ